jgi:hypothetical protein
MHRRIKGTGKVVRNKRKKGKGRGTAGSVHNRI